MMTSVISGSSNARPQQWGRAFVVTRGSYRGWDTITRMITGLSLNRATIEISGVDAPTIASVILDKSTHLAVLKHSEGMVIRVLHGVTITQRGRVYTLTGENGEVWTAKRAGGCLGGCEGSR